MPEQRVCECRVGYPDCEYCKFHRTVDQQRRTGRKREWTNVVHTCTFNDDGTCIVPHGRCRWDPCGHLDLTPGCEDCYPGWKKIARLIGSCGEVVLEQPYNGCSRWEVPMLNLMATRSFERVAPRQPMHEIDKQQTVVLYHEVEVHPACRETHSLVCDNVAKQLEDWKSLYAQTEMRVQELEKELLAVRGSNCEAPQMAEPPMKAVRTAPEAFLKPDGATSKAPAVDPRRVVKRREPMVIRCQGEED